MNTPYRPPPPGPPVVHYRDARLLAVEKPDGLLTVPGRGPEKRDCLLHRLQQDSPEVLLVHRLDMETSGLVLFALDADTQGRLGRLFQQRRVFKRYVAMVRGIPEEPEGEISLPLILDWPRRPRQKVDLVHGKRSHTSYRVVDRDMAGAWSRLELFPTTGRSHQLRVHLAAIGHPILGDALYADPESLAMSKRLMLHAATLRFEHPDDGRDLALNSPVPF